MEQFIHKQNILLYRRLLTSLTKLDEPRRLMLLKLLADEEAKDIPLLPSARP